MENLAHLSPYSVGDLRRFEFCHGMPIALRQLACMLGPHTWPKGMTAYALRNLFSRPLKELAIVDWPEERERMSRRQFRSVVILEDVLRRDLGISRESALQILTRVVSEVGSRFIQTHAASWDEKTWRQAPEAEQFRFAEGLVSRFFNARVEDLRVQETGMSFRVTRCRFAEMAQGLNRSYLAPLFCRADAVFFDRTPLFNLTRECTLADAGDYCQFCIALSQ